MPTCACSVLSLTIVLRAAVQRYSVLKHNTALSCSRRLRGNIDGVGGLTSSVNSHIRILSCIPSAPDKRYAAAPVSAAAKPSAVWPSSVSDKRRRSTLKPAGCWNAGHSMSRSPACAIAAPQSTKAPSKRHRQSKKPWSECSRWKASSADSPSFRTFRLEIKFAFGASDYEMTTTYLEPEIGRFYEGLATRCDCMNQLGRFSDDGTALQAA